ncbi:MAG TPA: hypothetical protein VGI45_13405 [Terracidiphilus sp.]|jgi:hypothetical protein
MNQADVAQVLLQTTGSLTPVSFTSASDLEEARTVLAQTLLNGITPEQLTSKAAGGIAKPTASHATIIDDSVHAQIQKLATSVFAAHSPTATPKQLAYLSSLSSPGASAPEWAAGMAVAKALGPFEDSSGIPYWVHLFNLTFSLRFAFGSAANVFGVFPVKIDAGDSLVHLDLGSGSIWFPAPWFAAGSPTGSFTGFKIQGGTLDFSAPVTLISGVVVLSPGTTFTLFAQPAANPSPAPANGPGADANHAKVTTPVNIQIEFSENSAKLISLDDSSLDAYGTTVKFHWNHQAPAFTSGQVAIACDTDVSSFSFSKVLSTVFIPSGFAAIAAGGWGLAAPDTTVANLGEADGAGYLYLGLGPGISAYWETQAQPYAFDGLILEASPGELSVTASSSIIQASTSTIELWDEKPASLNRQSTIEFLYSKPSVVYLASASTELLYVSGMLNAFLDRPLEANGSRFPFLKMNALAIFFAEAMQNRILLIAVPSTKPSVFSKELSIAFKNALLGVDPPSLLVLIGTLQSQTATLQQCRLALYFRAFWLLPSLPDPYAASFDTVETVRSQASGQNTETLVIQIQWSGAPSQPMMNLALSPSSQSGAGFGFLDEIVLRRRFGGLVLLDLSSRADLFGVQVGADYDAGDREQENNQENAPAYGFTELSLAFNQSLLATFALPQTSWEPMVSEEVPQGLITAGIDAGDGGPLVVHSVNFQQLVPLAPIPVLTSQVKNVAAGKPFHASFSLPFGLTASIQQPNALVMTQRGLIPNLFANLGAFRLNRPEFTHLNLRGGHQLTVIAPSNQAPPIPDQPNASFGGFTHVFPSPPNPGPSGYGYSVLGQDVGQIFEGEFGGGGGVPLRRIDFSGYGASIFSDWRDDRQPPAIIKVQFNTITGRTGYEVIKAETILYPYCVRLVRTVTIQRKLAGWVDRKDSGWQAATPGEFAFLTPEFIGHVHKGAVLGVYNVRNIRDLDGPSNVITATPHPPLPFTDPFQFRKVLFDAEIGIDNRVSVVAGGTVGNILDASGKPIMLVPSRDLVGYVQLSPVFDPADPGNLGYLPGLAQISSLMSQSGSLTPDLPCVMEVASLGAQPGVGLRCTTVEVNLALNGANAPAVAAAVRGAPQLPRDGAWSVGKRASTEPAPHPLPPNASIPLVQNATDTSAWHFADITDVLQLGSPDSIYSFLQSTGTQKVLFEQPNVPQAGITTGGGQAPGLQLPAAPSFGDMGALLNATGLFPDIANALSLVTGAAEQIENLASGLKYTKEYTYPLHSSTATGAKQSTLADLANVFKLELAYADTSKGTSKPTKITLVIDPTTSPRWSISITPLSLLVTIPTLSTAPLLTIIAGFDVDPAVYVGGFVGDENTKPHVTNLNVQFNDALAAIQTVFSRIEAIASFLPGGKAAGLKIGLSDGKLTVQDSFALPTLPLGLGELSGISLDLGLAIQLSPLTAGFTVGIGSPDNPFNWIVSPLSGNGLVDIGLKNNAPNIDLQAGIGLALAIDLGIASGSASIVIALNVDVNPPSVTLMVILTGQASVDVLDGLASASLTLTAGIGVTIDPPPIPTISLSPPEIDFPSESITMIATVSVGIHLSVAWVVSVDWDGSWQFSQGFTTPAIDVSL